jgi:AcrR family transcriptional regulator
LPPRSEPKGLRERKKARTRESIRDHAFRLFREQGYGATTVEQIAEAAEVSPSTFFRYFPNKEDVALTDDLDPLLLESFRAQPPELSQVAAIRAAIRSVLAETPPEVLERDRERQAVVFATPELRARTLDAAVAMVRMLAEVIAERTGRKPDDLEVLALAGAVIGAAIAAFAASADDPDAELFERVDETLRALETSIRL